MSQSERLTPQQLRSHRYLGPDDLRSFGHRSRQKQAGFSTEDFAGKPVIGILNTWNDLISCHAHFRQRAEEIKRGVEGLVVPEAMRDFVLRGVIPAATPPPTQGPT